MVLKCYVRGCHSQEQLLEKKDDALQFYRFPRKRKVLGKWREVCVQPLGDVYKARVCSLHFDEDSFNIKIRPPNLVTKHLKPGAIPKLLLPNRQDLSIQIREDVVDNEDIVICPDISSYEEHMDDEVSGSQKNKAMNRSRKRVRSEHTSLAVNHSDAVIEEDSRSPSPKYRLKSPRLILHKCDRELAVENNVDEIEAKTASKTSEGEMQVPPISIENSSKQPVIDLTDDENCCISNCSTNSEYTTNVLCFSLPKDDRKKTLWLNNIPYKNLNLDGEARICYKHFERHCFIKTGTNIDQSFKKRTSRKEQWDLTEDAIPTIFAAPHVPAADLQAKSTKSRTQKGTIAPSQSLVTRFSLDSTCRTCSAGIGTHWQRTPLFEGSLSLKKFRPDLMKEIFRFGLEIQENDGLPQQICQKCVDSFSIIVQFQKQCHTAQKELAKFFNINKSVDSRSKEHDSILEGEKTDAPQIQAGHKDVTKDYLPTPEIRTVPEPGLEASLATSIILSDQQEISTKHNDTLSNEKDSTDRVTQNESKKQNTAKVIEKGFIVGTYMNVGDELEEELSDYEPAKGNIADDDFMENWKCEYFIDPDDKSDTLKVLDELDQESTQKTSQYASHKPVICMGRNNEKKRCKLCQRLSRYCCDKCPSSPRLCLEPCFEAFHARLDEIDKRKPIPVQGYLCKKCDRILPSEGHNLHVNYCKGSPTKKTRSIKCTEQDQLLGHNTEFHNNYENLEKRTASKNVGGENEHEINSDTCNKVYLSTNYNTHVTKTQPSLQQQQEQKELREHIQIRTDDKPLTCDICGKSFPHVQGFKEHMINHNGKIEFTSESLKNGFLTNQKYNKHKNDQILEPFVNFNCEYCGIMSSRKNEIRAHFEKIHGVKFDESKLQLLPGIMVFPMTCDLCKQRFMSEVAFNSHRMNAHNPANKHECPKCGMRFGLASSLEQHIKRNGCPQPIFKCTICGVSKTSKKSYTWHMKLHKNNKRIERQSP